MTRGSEDWKAYFANVNDKLASIALDLTLADHAPMPSKPYLLWVWVYLLIPRPDGLSDNREFETLSKIEDQLSAGLAAACEAVEAGRITTEGRREFYFYGADENSFRSAVSRIMGQFSAYKFDLGSHKEADWNQYLNVLYPSEENFQQIKNLEILNVLLQHGDSLQSVRDVHHWIYFRNKKDRACYATEARELGYKIENESEHSGERSFGLHITRDQSVVPDQIDDAVLELFRLAKQYDADYDGWETRIVAPEN